MFKLYSFFIIFILMIQNNDASSSPSLILNGIDSSSTWHLFLKFYQSWIVGDLSTAIAWLSPNAIYFDPFLSDVGAVDEIARVMLERQIVWSMRDEPQLLFGTMLSEAIEVQLDVEVTIGATNKTYTGRYSLQLAGSNQKITLLVGRVHDPLQAAEVLRPNTPSAQFEHIVLAWNSGIAHYFLTAVPPSFAMHWEGFGLLYPDLTTYQIGTRAGLEQLSQALLGDTWTNAKIISPISVDESGSRTAALVKFDWYIHSADQQIPAILHLTIFFDPYGRPLSMHLNPFDLPLIHPTLHQPSLIKSEKSKKDSKSSKSKEKSKKESKHKKEK